jgi:hypothetical protein
MSTEAGRNELFGNAAQRQQAQPQQSGAYGASGAYGDSPSAGYGASGTSDQPPGAYGAYGDRELTAEEQEEEDINATKSEIKFIKQQDVSSTRNALRLAQQVLQIFVRIVHNTYTDCTTSRPKKADAILWHDLVLKASAFISTLIPHLCFHGRC